MKPAVKTEHADKIPTPPPNTRQPYQAGQADSPREDAPRKAAPSAAPEEHAAAKPNREDVHEQREHAQPREGVVRER